jgi:hypothetical protein
MLSILNVYMGGNAPSQLSVMLVMIGDKQET